MKKYVIITSSLSNMGGAQMYIRNKLLYLRQNGWNAQIIAGRADNIIIPELREFKDIIPEIDYCSYLYRKIIQKVIVNRIKLIICDKDYESIIIESTSTEVSTWAELVAKEIRAHHMIFLLQEYNHLSNNRMKDFYLFKYGRHELVGITKQSLVTMFKEFHPLESDESYCLEAFSNNVEADVDCDYIDAIDKSKYDYIVGGFSRLDKPFVLCAVDDFYNYALQYPDKRFLFMWIGGAPKGSLEPEKIKAKLDKLANVDLIITGYLLPVPIRLLEICDVFLSSSGSCWVCKRSGIPVISYDGNDYQPIGVLGWTTNNSLFRDKKEAPLKLGKLLDDIFVEKKYPKLQTSYLSGIPDFQSHINFLGEMESTLDYFDLKECRIESKNELKMALGLCVLGPKGYFRLHKIKMNR